MSKVNCEEKQEPKIIKLNLKRILFESDGDSDESYELTEYNYESHLNGTLISEDEVKRRGLGFLKKLKKTIK